MRKCFLLAALMIVSLLVIGQAAYAQRARSGGGSAYNTAVGVGVDFGDGSTGAGITAKHFFNGHDAGEANLLFYSGSVGLNALYEYHGDITNAAGLRWYLGLGPQFFFGDNFTDFGARPLVGLDYKINDVPLNFSFDWRPYIRFTHDTHFFAARFQFGFRYAF